MDYGREHDRQTGDEAQQRIKRLIHAAVTRCGACRRRYTLDDFAIIGHREHLWIVTVICEGCRNQGFITAIVEGHDGAGERPALPPGPDRRGRLSEFTPGDQARFAVARPVGLDDLLDLHDFLDDFDGDFAALLRKG